MHPIYLNTELRKKRYLQSVDVCTCKLEVYLTLQRPQIPSVKLDVRNYRCVHYYPLFLNSS